MEKREIEALRWFEQAEEDLRAAEDYLLIGKRYNWSCFISQQAAEKALKAIYYLKDEGVERVHSLLFLIQGDSRMNISGISEFNDMVDKARELDRVYIPARYPNGVPYGIPAQFYTKEDAEKCVAIAKEIVERARGLLKIT